MKSLETSYKPKDFEDKIYKLWQDHNSFAPRTDESSSYVIAMPPPNVTGVLHMGHGLQYSLQDILTRYQRMQGLSALWVPGVDHAGIATQNVVEKRLRSEGSSRLELGREAFVERTWQVKEEHHAIIKKQLEKIGSSCDWSRERFTLDDGLSKAVKETFVSLYEKGLVYRGRYLVNWCSSCHTALADDEVEHKDNNANLYEIEYKGDDFTICISTTRPETLFGDVAIAVNPNDERYQAVIGKEVVVPLTDRKIKIIADEHSKMEFGTGAVKITPAHDHNDYEVGQRHGLEQLNILHSNGTLNENVPTAFQGLDVKEARKQVVIALKGCSQLLNIEQTKNSLGVCYRCETVIEPYLSVQWFVKMKPLAEKALKAWEDGQIHFYPQKWENTYKHWLTNIRDWCVSRQLWWGHRIPVWYCNDCDHLNVSRDVVTACASCGGQSLQQDEDVLDTWFSSWLWPFSTLGWPEKTADLAKFFPTTTMVSGYDILFFWIARMVMASLEFLDVVPFTDIYLTPLVRDKQGRKMSKSLGNGIDPLEIVDEHGADALKFTLAFLSTQGEDIMLDKSLFKLGSKFCNKVWNASRYLLLNFDENLIVDVKQESLTVLDQWIYYRFNETVKAVENAFRSYRFDEAAKHVYSFFWNDFCDWYVECVKSSLSGDEAEKKRSVSLLANLLKESLTLLHPFMPLLTEEIYQILSGGKNGLLINQRYPKVREERHQPVQAALFGQLQELVQLLRTCRSDFDLSPKLNFKMEITAEDSVLLDYFQQEQSLIARLTNTEVVITRPESFEREKLSAEALGNAGKSFEFYIYIKDSIDIEQERVRLSNSLAKSKTEKEKIEKKLSNENFVAKAPADILAKEKARREELNENIERTIGYLNSL